MFETILAPLDGSKLATQAVPYVTEMAATFGSEVTLMGVCEPEESEQSKACQITVNLEAEGLSKALSSSKASVKTIVLTGRPAQKIIDYAEKNKIGIIILTSHGRSGIAPWSLGSTVQKILQLKLTAPLLLVKAKEVPEHCDGLFERILMPLDTSKRGEAAIPYVVELARKFETEVILFRVIEEGRHVHSVGGLQYVRFLDQDVKTAKNNAVKYFNEVSAQFAGTKAKIVHEIRVGDAAREILKMAEEQKRCLVAMASHGHTGIEAWALGSITYKIVQATDKPLLLVKARLKA